jgi:serine/threonine-protein kinase
MGEVYRARDTKLKREVAIKLLPDEFSRDGDRTSRFQREAEVLASLNHPNIGAIYDLLEAEGSRFLVLELVEGETLAERIARGPIPLEDALDIAKQIGDALEAAHEKGVIHRDLKPANVKVSPEGKVKVLDFGLAKAMSGANASATAGSHPGMEGTQAIPTLSNSPTMLTSTMGGMILGTVAYMSPEQAKGRPADKRSDVWAFGCVFYEMLAGRSAFGGEDISDTLAAVLRAEPDWTALPADLRLSLRIVVEGCLKKDRRERIGDISAARFLMREAAGLLLPPPAPSKARRLRGILIAMAALVVGALAGIGIWISRTPTPSRVSRSTFTLPEGQNFTGTALNVVAISRDGSQIAYVADRQLHIRAMSDFSSKVVPGSEGALITTPVFSPDGRSIVFYSGTDRAIKRLSTAGGVSVPVCSIDNAPYGLTWDSDDIVFADRGKGIMRVPAKGGNPELLAKLSAGEIASAAQILPDANAVLFAVAKGMNNDQQMQWNVVAQSLKTGERKSLISNGAYARYVPTGHIVYASLSSSGATLFAVPFDVRRLKLAGEPTPVVEGVRRTTSNGIANFSVSETGTLVYVPGRRVSSEQLDLALVDGKGSVQPLKLPPAAYEHPRVSPDGRQVAYSIDDGKEANIWIYDLSGTSAPRRLTSGGRNRFPVWSGNGQRIAFQSNREGSAAIYWQRADISGGIAERLTMPEQGTVHIPESWSRDNETLVFSTTKDSVVSLWTFSMRDQKVAEFGGVRSSTPTDAVFSPDGRWIAYATTDEGHFGPYVQPRGLELYVQPFPPTGEKYLISSTNGIHPAWSRDGHELIFNYPGQLMTVSVTTHPVFSFTKPAQLLRGGVIRMPWPAQRDYDVAPDGKLIGTIAQQNETGALQPIAPQIRIVQNWFEELKERVPIKP